jgi:putative serine protease PepD
VTFPARSLLSRPWLGIAVSAVGAAAVLGACTFPVRFATPAEVAQAKATPPAQIVAPAAPPAPGGLTQVQADLRRLIAQIGPSVVRVDAGTMSGSGLLIDAQGTVVTPASLVAGSQQVTVTVASGQQYSAAVSGSDPASDIALLRVTAASGLTPVTFGDSATVQPGDVVLAVGNQIPSSATVSQGIVSGTAGTMPSGSVTLTGLIQTTAPMASGTSGSALVNVAGQVIGMTTLGSVGSAGLGVAIPSNQVNTVAQRLLAAGPGTQTGTAYLGVTAADAAGGGARVQSVVAGGPAARAGVQVGWIIVGIGGHTVANAAAITPILAMYTPGQRVVLTVQVNGSTRSIPVVLGA